MRPTDLGLPSRFPSFRVYPGFDQLAVAQDLAAGYAEHRFQMLQAATGSGKSLTSATVAALLARDLASEQDINPNYKPFRWLVLTGTKGLQVQYQDDGLAQCSVVGHRNYPCMPRAPFQGMISAEDPDDPEFRCMAIPRDTCGYLADTTRARESSGVAGVVGNYAHWLSLGRYSDPKLLGEFDLLVMDEAHSGGEWLTRAMQIYLSPFAIGKVLGINGPYRMPSPAACAKIEEWNEWFSELAARVEERYQYLAMAKDAPGARRAERLSRELTLLMDVSENLELAGLSEPWVVIPQDQRPGYVFSPRWGSDFAERFLFRGIPRVLLTSATVTPQHAKQLGISPDAMRFREVPSPFDPRRRPVVYVPTTRVDYRMTDGQRWLLMRRIDQVVEAAIELGAGNGLIHSVSYEWAEQIKRESAYSAAILTHRKDSTEFQAALERFKAMGRAGQFAVICSPRMVEGVDLPDELCRWQVVVKVPTPNSQEPLEAARNKDKDYRNLVVAMKITQMVGRPVRGIGDFATTVIFDDHWGQHVARECPFAQWMRAAFRAVRPDDVGRVDIGKELLTRERVESLGPAQTSRVAQQVVQFIQP
jgi:ATP-dependent DNA helicase DinG